MLYVVLLSVSSFSGIAKKYFVTEISLGLTLCHFFLVFFSPFSIAITSLGEGRANLSAFRTFLICACLDLSVFRSS